MKEIQLKHSKLTQAPTAAPILEMSIISDYQQNEAIANISNNPAAQIIATNTTIIQTIDNDPLQAESPKQLNNQQNIVESTITKVNTPTGNSSQTNEELVPI